jgi:2-hydroxychromene-2-carboxylate isomerase
MSVRQQLKGWLINAFLNTPVGEARERLRAFRSGATGGHRTLSFYYRVDDPYSHLLVQALPALTGIDLVDVEVIVVPAGEESVDPEPELRRAFGVRDARELAHYFDIEFPEGPEHPSDAAIARANAILLVDRPAPEQLRAAREVGDAVWAGDDAALAAAEESWGVASGDVAATLDANNESLRKHGHYQGGMLHLGGNWYWGLDRLNYLEDHVGASAPLVTMRPESSRPVPERLPTDDDGNIVLEMFYSFRSPYSYLALERALELTDHYPVALEIRPVLPMVMRGFEVPLMKRMYIVRDSKREADRLGIPFGRICDPVGVGTERCIAMFDYATKQGRGAELARSAARGIWSQALDVASDKDLRVIVERAGLDWSEAFASIADESWRELAENNRAELFEMGLWGVPCFRLGDYTTWGQDRLWIIVDKIRRHLASHSS